MHECLRIPEIRGEIFGTLNSVDCSVLARTCRLFYSDAMDVVWADLQSLIPLVRCMPADVVDKMTYLAQLWYFQQLRVK